MIFRRHFLLKKSEESSPVIPAILPSGYVQLKYIESTGNGTNSGGQYINTGITQNGFVLEADLVIKGNVNSERSLCGTYGGGASYLCNWNGSSGFFNYGDSQNVWTPSTLTIGNRYQVVSTNTAPSAVGLTRPPWLFSQNQGANYGYHSSSIQLYHAKFTYSSTTIRDFYPCYRVSDGAAGLYDIINDVFYPNLSGGTDFIKGPEYIGVL